ncbi:hypothetical protein TIFTF001_033005 [Ficus carica]|uniref:Uncharacterized protein n=1 Tax=Ficus carica TaxID=3494 RepID=A0AA88E191_FICCA|nr:hypothetical protein TIFTF001_033005 [Ficus carica]
MPALELAPKRAGLIGKHGSKLALGQLKSRAGLVLGPGIMLLGLWAEVTGLVGGLDWSCRLGSRAWLAAGFDGLSWRTWIEPQQWLCLRKKGKERKKGMRKEK